MEHTEDRQIYEPGDQGFVLKPKRRDEFQDWEALRNRGAALTIADLAEEVAAHTLFHPRCTVVVPRLTTSIPVSHAVAHVNQGLLPAINAWLLSEQAKGTADELYEHLMLGGGIERDRPPPWSTIRNVLGWVD